MANLRNTVVTGSLRLASHGAGMVRTDANGTISTAAMTAGDLPSHNHDDRYYTESEINSLLSAKQDAATAITTSNIGSQSVNYANSAGTSGQVSGVSVSSSEIQYLKNTLDSTSLPYKCDIYVDGDPNTYYPVHFIWGDQDVWRRIIIKRGYSEEAPWDPVGSGVHHGGLLLDWEGNFGGWGGAEYSDRLRVFNESYTNICADMFIYTHSMGYVFMLRGGHALYHIFSDQPIRGYHQTGTPDIAYDTSTLFYDHSIAGYRVYAPAPVTSVNSSRIDGLRTKKQSLLDGRYQPLENQRLSTGNSPSFSSVSANDVYTTGGWFRNHTNNSGIYWSNTAWHLMPENTADFRFHSGNNSESAIRMETNGTTRGYVYANSSNEIGFLNNGRTWRLRVYSGGAVESYGDFRAPIFYDSENTAYYLDPASTSNILAAYIGRVLINHDGTDTWFRMQSGNRMRVTTTGGNDFIIPNTGDITFNGTTLATREWVQAQGYRTTDSDNQTLSISGSTLTISGGNSVALPTGGISQGDADVRYLRYTGAELTEGNYFYYRSNRGSYLGGLDSATLQVYATGGNSAFMSFHRSGNYAVNFGLDADNVMRIGGWSAAGDRWVLDMSGNNTVAGSFRAPIFYDSNDTTFYVDPASSSRLRNLYVGDGGSNWSDPGGWGTQLHVSNGPHSIIRVYARTEGIETVMYSHGGGQSKVGSGTNHDFSIVRNFSDRMIFYSGYTYANGYLQAADSLRAPIFYDSNDTNYYVDPNSNSYLSRLHVADASSGVSLHVGLGSTHGVYTLDNDRKYLVVSGEYYPHMALVARSANNTNHGAVFSFVGSEGGAFRQWNLGISNNDPFLFSIGYNRTTDPNPHYGVGDGWSGDDNNHARLSIDRDGNTKIRGMLYVNGTSGGISTGSAVIHAGNIGSQSVNYASSANYATSAGNADTVDGYHESAFWRNDQNRVIGVLRFTGEGGDSGNGSIATSYGIYQQGGSWTYPYPDLCIGYHTGIKIGAHYSYQGTRFYNNSDWETEIFSVGNGDNHVRVQNNLYVYGNTYLGDGNGDEVHINDILRVGATDSGDAHIFFGEGGSAGSDYGAHLYWDSGYTFTWNTRNAGSDTRLFSYVTNDTTYLYWNRHHHLENKELNYVGQLHLNNGFALTQSGSYGYINNWLKIGTTGFFTDTNSAHIYPNTSTSYGSWRIDGSRSGWRGINFNGNVTLMMNDNETGFYRDGYGWQWRWENGTAYVHKNGQGGGTSATVLDSSNWTSHVTSLQGYSAYNLVEEARGVHSGSDFPNGTLVTTDIYADGWSGDSFVMEVSGKSYDSGNSPFKLIMQGYLYADTIINVSAMSYGSYFPGPVTVMRLNGNIAFWWPRGSYWNSFQVHVRDAGGNSWNRVTGISNSDDPGGDKRVSITPIQVLHTNNAPYALRMNQDVRSSDNVEFNQVSVRGALYVGTYGNSSDIYMTDGDEGTRRIHCNSNRVGFLTQGGSWGSWCNDDGSWNSDGNITTAGYFYSNYSIRIGEIWGLGGVYRSSGDMLFGTESSADWYFRSGNNTRVRIAGGDGNIWMSWAGDWISNLLGAKQNASTAITTSNIGSQSVAYASTSYIVNSTNSYRHSNRSPNSWEGLANSWHFNDRDTVGLGGDYWVSILTVSPWYGYADSHRQQQLSFSGSAGLYHRYAVSGDSWSGWSRIYSDAYRPYADSAGNADTVDGYHMNQAVTVNASPTFQEVYANGWFRSTGHQGHYNPTNSAHFYPNDNSYGAWKITGSRNGWGGINLQDPSGFNHYYMHESGNGGYLTHDRWAWYWHRGNNSLGLGESTTSSSYKVYVTGSLYATGDIVAYSDRRKKTDIVTIEDALSKVKEMRGVFYTKIDEAHKGRQVGVIAQEMNEVLPEAVTYAADVDEYGVKYGNIVGVLIEAIKEQQKQIEELKAKLV